MMYKKNFKPGELFNAHKAMAMGKKKVAKKHKYMPAFGSKATAADRAKYPSMSSVKPTSPGDRALNRMNAGNNSDLNMVSPGIQKMGKSAIKNVGNLGIKFKGKKRKGRKPTGAHGRAAVRALGRTKTTGNFAKIEKKSGKGAAIAAYQNALRAHKAGKHKKMRKKHKSITGKYSLPSANKNGPPASRMGRYGKSWTGWKGATPQNLLDTRAGIHSAIDKGLKLKKRK